MAWAEAHDQQNLSAARVLAASQTELEWLYRTTARAAPPEGGGANPSSLEQARVIRGWIDQLPTFHAGALSIHHTPRRWPPTLRARFGVWTSLVVRLDCAMHPSDGTKATNELEAESVARLEASIAYDRDKAELQRLQKHAKLHVRAALRAYALVRGIDPCVLSDAQEGA